MTRPPPRKFIRRFVRRFRGGHHVGYVLLQRRAANGQDGCRMVRYDVFCGDRVFNRKLQKGISWICFHVQRRNEINGKTAWRTCVQTKSVRWAKECFLNMTYPAAAAAKLNAAHPSAPPERDVAAASTL